MSYNTENEPHSDWEDYEIGNDSRPQDSVNKYTLDDNIRRSVSLEETNTKTNTNKSILPTFIYTVNINNGDNISVTVNKQTNPIFKDSRVFLKSFNVTLSNKTHDTIVKSINTLGSLLIGIFIQIVTVRNNLKNKIGARHLLYFPLSKSAVGYIINDAIITFFRTQHFDNFRLSLTDEHLRDLTIIYETDDLLDIVVEDNRVHRIYNAIDYTLLDSRNGPIISSKISKGNVSVRDTIKNIEEYRKSAQSIKFNKNKFLDSSRKVTIKSKYGLSRSINLNTLYNERGVFVDIYNAIYGNNTSFMFRLFNKDILYTKTSTLWYENIWAYDYFLNKGMCTSGRLIQLAGTCWYNALLNVLFLTPEIKHILSKNFHSFSDDEKLKICNNNDLKNCKLMKTSSCSYKKNLSYPEFMDIKYKLYNIFKTVILEEKFLRSNKQSANITSTAFDFLSYMYKQSRFVEKSQDKINLSSEDIDKNKNQMASSSHLAVIPLANLLFHNGQVAFLSNFIQTTEGTDIMNLHRNTLLALYDNKNNVIKPENFQTTAFSTFSKIGVTGEGPSPPELVIFNIPLRISPGMFKQKIIPGNIPTQITSNYIDLKEYNKNSKNVTVKSNIYTLTSMVLNLKVMKYKIRLTELELSEDVEDMTKQDLWQTFDDYYKREQKNLTAIDTLTHAIMCSHCDGIYYIYDSNNYISEYDWYSKLDNKIQLDSIFEEYENHLQYNNYSVTGTDAADPMFLTFARCEIEQIDTLFYTLSS